MAATHGKQFTLYSYHGGANGWKVAIVLEELRLSYETIYLDFGKQEHKAPEYTKYNPNGRIPTLIDHHNGDFVIWESCAIILYLVEKYDKDNKLYVTDFNERTLLNQYLFFQASGQGPYFGQAMWFNNYHPEKIPTAIDRYKNEVIRVFGVLETILTGKNWLVGDKYTIADLSFIMWNLVIDVGLLDGFGSFNMEKDFPSVLKWHRALCEIPSVKRSLALRAKLMAQ
ncbi:glutathione S-transferase [Abortiporus biennis]|nr:glutathione S-transferase [Abortiporus biennis]